MFLLGEVPRTRAEKHWAKPWNCRCFSYLLPPDGTNLASKFDFKGIGSIFATWF